MPFKLRYYFNARQVESFQRDIGYYFKLLLKDKYTLEEILTNLENYDSATTKLLEKLDAINEVKIVETKATDDIMPEINNELVQLPESSGE